MLAESEFSEDHPFRLEIEAYSADLYESQDFEELVILFQKSILFKIISFIFWKSFNLNIKYLLHKINKIFIQYLNTFIGEFYNFAHKFNKNISI